MDVDATSSTDPVTAAVAALNEHDAECELGRWECEKRTKLAAARRKALRGAPDTTEENPVEH